MVMTNDQKRLVRESFEDIREVAGPLSLLFYGKLFELAPESRQMFHNDLRLQGLKLMDMLTATVEALDNFEGLRAKLGELGRRHAGYGVRDEQYDTVRKALLWAIGQALSGGLDSRTRDAWTVLIESVNQAMKSGVGVKA
jgi:hemoglobin-like flavoprotein